MAGKVASATPYISELEEGLNGSSSRKDLETMFQLIYLRFTQPRADANAFAFQAAQAKTFLANQSASPEFVVFPTRSTTPDIRITSAGGCQRRLQSTNGTSTNLWRSTRTGLQMRVTSRSSLSAALIWRRSSLWSSAIWDRCRPSAGKSPGKTWVCARRQYVVEKKVEKGIEPKSESAIVFSGPFEYDPTHRVAIRAMAEILQTRLLETIREELGGTYSINATAGYERIPNPTYSITIQFGSAPDRTENLIKRVFQEIELLKTNGPTDKQVNDEKEALLREYETNSKLNNYLADSDHGQVSER